MWFSIPTFGLLATGVNVQVLLFAVAGVIALAWVSWEASRRFRRTHPAASGAPHEFDLHPDPHESGAIP